MKSGANRAWESASVRRSPMVIVIKLVSTKKHSCTYHACMPEVPSLYPHLAIYRSISLSLPLSLSLCISLSFFDCSSHTAEEVRVISLSLYLSIFTSIPKLRVNVELITHHLIGLDCKLQTMPPHLQAEIALATMTLAQKRKNGSLASARLVAAYSLAARD